MLDSNVKKKLLIKLDNLIAEKKESELLREEFIKWFNSGEPFLNVMNESEKRILEKYPNLVVRKNLYFNLYSNIIWSHDGIFGNKIFDGKEKNMVGNDNNSFYIFNLITYPDFFDLNYSAIPLANCNKKVIEQVSSKVWNLLRVRKKYLEKKEFIKRVLDSRELTITVLKNNYKDLYDLLGYDKG